MDVKMNNRRHTHSEGQREGSESDQIAYKMLCRVLLVEDDIDDQFFAREELKRCENIGKVECFPNGKALFEYLYQRIVEDKDFLSGAPTVIVLDLNMPLMNGLETLRQVKTDPLLKNLPVIVVTGEKSAWEIEQALIFKAAAVFKKPLNVDRLRKFLEHDVQWSWSKLWH
jgi:CheY-like chemotaxis protein